MTLALFGLLATLLFRVPYVYNTPDLQVEIAGERKWIYAPLLIRMAHTLEKLLMQRALTVATVTEAFIDHFVKRRGIAREKMSFLPNGVDIAHLRPTPFDPSYAQWMGVAGKTVFTYAGTHADYQGLDIILDAAELLKGNSDIVFLMVGKGPERARLIHDARKRQLENVFFRDSPFSEMSQLMSITYAALVVLRDIPAAKKMRLSKTFPPLACGVPVVYAGRGESADILETHRCGVVTAPENPAALARAIQALVLDPKHRDTMGRNGRRLMVSQFSWKTIVDRWLNQIDHAPLG